jgi:periplasmic protein TonB
MRDPLSRSFASLSSSTDSWFLRVRENLRQFFTSSPLFPSSANGAPIHLLKFRRDAVIGGARTVSLVTHVAILCGILLLSVPPHAARVAKPGSDSWSHARLSYFPPPDANLFGRPSLGKNGGGGEEDPRPARYGFLAPGSSMPLAPPRLPQNPHPVLPVAAAVFDANAPEFTKPINDLGLPWMKENSDSAGPGKNHGIGSGREGGMGDRNGPGAGWGESENGPYANVVSLPKCAYCPDPQYTDEAREARLQGSVTLMVLVDADGRAAQIRITQVIGLGLDERAVQAIRTWRFVPARDAARRAVPAWVTVETVYRLF